MRFELGLEEPDPRRALRSAADDRRGLHRRRSDPAGAVHGGSATRDGLSVGLWLSVRVTLFALIVFGYIKGHFTGTRPIRSAFQTTLIGGIAAAAAFLIARVFS